MDLLPTALMDIGHLQMLDGLGFQIIPGDGHLFTMVAGCMMIIMVGHGFLEINGVQDGLLGEDHKTITVGHQ